MDMGTKVLGVAGMAGFTTQACTRLVHSLKFMNHLFLDFFSNRSKPPDTVTADTGVPVYIALEDQT